MTEGKIKGYRAIRRVEGGKSSTPKRKLNVRQMENEE